MASLREIIGLKFKYNWYNSDSTGYLTFVRDIKFWYVEKLFFTIPEKYMGHEPIDLFTSGTNIGLGVEMTMANSEKTVDNYYVMLAKEILPGLVDDDNFIISNYNSIEPKD